MTIYDNRNSTLPTYSAVYVISDLHLGGYSANFDQQTRNYRIFREAEALASFIRLLAASEAEARAKGLQNYRFHPGPIALVLNGDIVDFLADEKATYFDWLNAVDKLASAMKDNEQKVVWEALKDFVASGRGDLVLVLGNHDLELALPEPQALLQRYLAGENVGNRGRIVFAMDGAGFSCTVGNKRVLCLHGNEADPWNAIDYGKLSLIRRTLARGSLERNHKILRQWIPNAGTQMVIEYMNAVKRRYQWVDLLKPEQEAAAMVTSAIARLPGPRTFAEVQVRKAATARKLTAGFLGATVPVANESEDGEDTPLPEPRVPLDKKTLMRETLESLGRGAAPVDLVTDEEFLMGSVEAAITGLVTRKWPKTLREVLSYSLAQDQTFEPGTVDEVYTELDRVCGAEIDFLIAGHTHLYRAIERAQQPGRYYFNSGTWIWLVRIPNAALSHTTFPKLKDRLEEGSMEALEADLDGSKLILKRRTVVTIQVEDGMTRGMLNEVAKVGAQWDLVETPNTALPRR
ncbi:MAG TPA: metallophosphoesterase [Polyangiaceae bacterium]|nr:metallophosphoesterase [Polyangiaceae bacterium]